MAQPEEVKRLMAAYEVIVDFRDNHPIFADDSTLQYDDGTKKSTAEALRRVSEALDNHPEWAPYLKGASTLIWRKISGTDRLSAHSFGIAIDIHVEHADYWRWSKSGDYRNRIPEGLVAVFEQNGFIWGGCWSHFDTMHFEYRPELLP